MPFKAKHGCSHPGCPCLTDGRYCEAHTGDAEKYRAEANAHYNRNVRDKDAQAFYNGTPWRKLRAVKLRMKPICEECYRQRRLTPATIVDHIQDIATRPDLRLDMENLQSICIFCHNRKHGRG
jgi:5-methylcytosine-specific restriction protein A